jgi:hypothetical protein
VSGCAGKERFTTFAFAARVASLSASRNEGARRQAYKCADCGAFHVGSSVGPKLQGKKRRERFWTPDEDEAYA